MTRRPVIRRLAAAALDDIRRALVRLCGYLCCGVCGEHHRGWRTLLAHAEREHPGES